jgi:hypothetical protein
VGAQRPERGWFVDSVIFWEVFEEVRPLAIE